MLIALFIGVAIPGSVVFAKENLDVTIRGEKDLEHLSAHLLGVIALAEQKEPKLELLVRETGTDKLNESLRKVRTNLDVLRMTDVDAQKESAQAQLDDLKYHYTADIEEAKINSSKKLMDREELAARNYKLNQELTDKKNVIMFTSFEPGSGKSFASLNLAMTMALAGKKIALIDLDMRTAALSKITSDPPQGLGIYLNELIPEERFIIMENYFLHGFDFIPAGEIQPNPTELLMTNRFKGLIDRLKRNYDYVFLDTTPLDLVTDAIIIGKHADLAVFVVREGYTNRRKLRELDKVFQKGQFKKMATILNASRVEVTYSRHHTKYKVKLDDLNKLKEQDDSGRLIDRHKNNSNYYPNSQLKGYLK